MELTTLVLGCFLFGQLAEPGRLPSSDEAEPAGLLQPIVPLKAEPTEPSVAELIPAAKEATEPQQRNWLTPPEMVVEALAPRPAGKVTGQPLPLAAALPSAVDRQQQLAVIHAYWRLAQAVAVYHFAWEYDGLLQRMEADADEATRLRTARASSAALVGEAEVAAVAAQHDLAALAGFPADTPLSLPADHPHVGPYRTRFAELSSTQAASARARLLDRTLPIRCEAIDERALAARAAEEAFSAAVDARQTGTCDLAEVLDAAEECFAYRRAFIAAVCRYNNDIAEYALAVAGLETLAKDLVRMLIRPTDVQDSAAEREPEQALVPLRDSAVEPAGLNEPVPTPALRPKKNQPTPALRPGKNEPTPAAPRESTPETIPEVPTLAPQWTPSEPSDEDDADSVPPPETPVTRAANKPVLGQLGDDRPSDSTAALYSRLTEATPGARARLLAESLPTDRWLPEEIGQPIGLEECLGNRSTGDRLGLIEAYWLVRQRAAEYQVLAQQADWLAAAVAEDDKDPSALRLRTARLATGAALREAHAALIEAQAKLAARMGHSSDRAWPLADTVPHSGRYLLKLESQPRHVAQSWPMRRLAALIPGMAESVQRRATAVVEADAARAVAMAGPADEGRSTDRALECITRQTAQTRTFLKTLTDYNRAIAQYALTVLPPETPDGQLVKTLVMKP